MKHIVDTLLANAGLLPREVAHDLRIRVLRIGPAEAKALLAANRDNRKIRPNRVRFYERVMQEGGWMLTHQGIAFSSDGVGIDLQHRLTAVLNTGAEITIMVVEGLEPAAFEAIDQHERRSMADALKIRRDVVEEARFLITVAGGSDANNPTAREIDEVACNISTASDTLLELAPSKRAIMTAVPMRAAAIMLMMERPAEGAQIGHRYRMLSLLKTEAYTPSMHAFQRQVTDKRISTKDGQGRIDLFLRGLRVLDPDLASLSVIKISDGAIDLIRPRVRALFADA